MIPRLYPGHITTDRKASSRAMGVCGSKQETTNKESDADMSGTRTVRTTQNQNRVGTEKRSKTGTHSKTKKQSQSKTPHSKGDIVGAKDQFTSVGSSTEQNAIQLSPREAARLAAEKRLKDSTKQLTKGQLGKKLAEQKGLKA